MLRISARKGLLAARFRHGPIDVSETSWIEVDANDAATRAVLLAYVPSHIRIGEGQARELLTVFGLELVDAKLVDVRARVAKEAAVAASSPPPEQRKDKGAARAEK